jgi:hypothetical protein
VTPLNRPTIADGIVYVTSGDGTLSVYGTQGSAAARMTSDPSRGTAWLYGTAVVLVALVLGGLVVRRRRVA